MTTTVQSTPAKFFSLALMLVLLLGSLRGGATSISKLVSMDNVPPIGYALWQSIIAATVLIGLAYWQTGRMVRFKGHLRYYLFCGLIGTALPNTIFFEAIRHIPAGTMAVLLTLVPILVYLLALLVRLERIDGIRFGGILLGFAGASMIALQKVSGQLGVDGYVLFAMLCPLGYALMGVFVGRFPVAGGHPLHLATGTHIVSAGFLLPAALATDQFHPIWLNPGSTELLMICHGLMAAISYALFFKIVAMAGVVFYSLSHYVIAMMGLAWGWIIFSELHGVNFWIAVVLILAGLSLVNLRQHQLRSIKA